MRGGQGKASLNKAMYERLHDAVNHAYKEMAPYRERRAEILKQLGAKIGKGGTKNETLVNKLRQMSSIYLRLLASGTMMTTMDSKIISARPVAEKLQSHVNRLAKWKLKADTEIPDWILDAIVLVGIMKVALKEGNEYAFDDGERVDMGEPYMARVSLNNFVIDMAVEDRNEVDFAGDRFPRPLEWLKERYPGREKDLSAENPEAGVNKPEPRVSGASRDPEHRMRDYVYVWDIYLPKERLVVRKLEDVQEPLEVKEWTGPERGPYHILPLFESLDDVIPTSPAHDLMPLHKYINVLQRKFGARAVQSKNILAYEDTAAKDAERIDRAGDGSKVKVSNVDKLKELYLGRQDPADWNAEIRAEQQFDALAGNLAGLGGLGPQSKTATQDQMLMSAANAVLDNMRRKIVSVTRNIIEDIAWYVYNDPVTTFEVSLEAPGMPSLTIQSALSFEQRQAVPFEALEIEIQPYSMREDTPDQKAERVLSHLERWVLPSLPFAQQAGFSLNVMSVARLLSKWLDIPFEDIYMPLDPSLMQSQQMGGGEGEGPAQPANTTRTYERISRPGTTQRGNEAALMQSNLGSRPQNDMAAILGQA